MQLHEIPPIELIVQIFGETRLPHTNRDENCIQFYIPPSSWLLKLGDVCQARKQIASAAPSLCTEFTIDLDKEVFNSVLSFLDCELAKEWLDHIGVIPLQIYVNIEADCRFSDNEPVELDPLRDAIDLITTPSYSARWQYVQLRLRLPEATISGRISTQRPQEKLSPGLQTLPKEVQITRTHLTILRVVDIYSDQAVQIFSIAPQLTICSMLNVIYRENPALSFTRHVHTSLSKLWFRSTTYGASQFLRHLTLSNLAALKLESSEDNEAFFTHRITRFFRRSSPPLRYLEIDLPNIHSLAISRMLNHLPSLVSLGISGLFKDTMWTQIFKSIKRQNSSGEVFLPDLLYLAFTHPHEAGPSNQGWDTILETLRAAVSESDSYLGSLRGCIFMSFVVPRHGDWVLKLEKKQVVRVFDMMIDTGVALDMLCMDMNRISRGLDLVGLREKIDTMDQHFKDITDLPLRPQFE